MKETVLDVLLYLFENYAQPEEEPEVNRVVLRGELQDAGFHHRAIDGALRWLEQLGAIEELPLPKDPAGPALRLFNRRELMRLEPDALGYIMELEQTGVLTPTQRETLLDRLLALDSLELNIEQIKWVALMVLCLKGERDDACLHMEQLMFDNEPITLH